MPPRSLLTVPALALLALAAFGADKKQQKEQEESEDAQLTLKACGTREKEVMYVADTDKGKHPTPDPPAGKAIVYVVRPTLLGNKVQTKLAVNGDWKGVNRGNNYFYFTLDPGDYLLCSKAENRSVEKLRVEPDKAYYVQQHVRMGLMKARNSVEILSEEDGKKALTKCHPSTWEIK